MMIQFIIISIILLNILFSLRLIINLKSLNLKIISIEKEIKDRTRYKKKYLNLVKERNKLAKSCTTFFSKTKKDWIQTVKLKK